MVDERMPGEDIARLPVPFELSPECGGLTSHRRVSLALIIEDANSVISMAQKILRRTGPLSEIQVGESKRPVSAPFAIQGHETHGSREREAGSEKRGTSGR